MKKIPVHVRKSDIMHLINEIFDDKSTWGPDSEERQKAEKDLLNKARINI